MRPTTQHPHTTTRHRARCLAGLLATLLLAGPATAQTQDLDLRTQVDFSTWVLLGGARTQVVPAYAGPGGPVVGLMHELILTDATADSAGAGFAPDQLLLNFNHDFSFQFNAFLYGPALRGDGMTFLLTTASEPAIGGGGSDLGYGASNLPGYALAIDTFHFEGEAVSPSLQILRDGSSAPLAATETGLGDDVRNLQTWHTSFVYAASGNQDEAGTLTATIFRPDLGSFSVSSAADWSTIGEALFDDASGDYLGRLVRYGFTAGNGAASDGHLVASLTPVPEPHTYAMLLAGLALMGALVRRRWQVSHDGAAAFSGHITQAPRPRAAP
jgi:Bacterial lectin/PEP-CTERM motif